jgi:hypothetical protein
MPDTSLPTDQQILPTAAHRLPRVQTELSPQEVLERLDRMSRRGKLPGFTSQAGGGIVPLFSVEAHGSPFDGDLSAHYRAAGEGPGGDLEFDLQMRWRLPALFAAALLATIWPGVYFTDELIAQHLPGLWRPWVTYWWYLPLTIIPLPWVWAKLMRRSRHVVQTSARETIEKIAAEVQGRIVAP